MQTTQINVRLPPDDMDALKALATEYGLNPTMLAKLFVSSALKAVKASGQKITLPLEFHLATAPREAWQVNAKTEKTRR